MPIDITLSLLCGGQKRQNLATLKRYWEIIADNLSKAGWPWGCVATVDRGGRTVFIADAHCDDGQRFVVHADDRFTAFLELERAIAVDNHFATSPRLRDGHAQGCY